MNWTAAFAGPWLACFLGSVPAVAGPQPPLLVVLSETGKSGMVLAFSRSIPKRTRS